MTLSDVLTMFGASMGVAAAIGGALGFLYFWLPKNIK